MVAWGSMPQRSDDLWLRIGYWLAVHRDQLRTWWGITIIVADLAFLGAFVFLFARYSLSTGATIRGVARMADPLVTPSLRSQIAPQPLELGSAIVLPQPLKRFDLAATVKNPNPTWFAVEVRYRFHLGSLATREERMTVWPGGEAFLIQRNVVAEGFDPASPVTVELLDVRWERPQDLALAEVRLTLESPTLVPTTGLSTGAGTRLNATLRNGSVDAFRDVQVGVIVRSSGVVTAVGVVQADALGALGQVPIELIWGRVLSPASTVTVFPLFNPLAAGTIS